MTIEQPTVAIAYTIQDASRLSTVSRTALYAAMAGGDLKARKFGRRTLILDEDLRAWLTGLPATHDAP